MSETKPQRGNCIPTSKKQLEKLNKVKKAKAEELSKQAAADSQVAQKKLKKPEKKSSSESPGSCLAFFSWASATDYMLFL
jgi:hypothetical protein